MFNIFNKTESEKKPTAAPAHSQTIPATKGHKGRRLVGVVTSDKMQKTVVVTIERLRKHSKYLKYFKVTSKFKAHDEKNEYHIGDKVVIQETRPLSKDKCWIVIERVAGPKVKEAITDN